MSEQQLVESNGDEPIIIARDVHKWFGQFHALRGIDMEVQKGEKIVIFGPSGSHSFCAAVGSSGSAWWGLPAAGA